MRIKAFTAVGNVGSHPKALQILYLGLKDKSERVRRTCASVLGEVKAPESIPALQEALADSDDEVAFAAASALWGMGDKTGRDVVYQVLTGERDDAPGMVEKASRTARHKLRHPASLALTTVKMASNFFPILGPAGMGLSALQTTKSLSDSGTGRASAVALLADDPEPYALTLLEWALDDNSWLIRAAAAKALGDRGNEGSIFRLATKLDDDRHTPRFVAAASIIRLDAKFHPPQPRVDEPVTK